MAEPFSQEGTSLRLSVRRIAILLGREFTALNKWKPSVYTMLVTPLSYLFLFSASMASSLGFIRLNNLTVTYFSFLFPGIVAMQCFGHFSQSLTDCSNERRWGLLKSYFLASVQPADYVSAKMIGSFLTLLFQSSIMYLGGCILGWLSWSPGGLVRLLPCALLVSSFWTTLGITLGCRITREDVRASLTALLVLPVTLTASVFYDIRKAPPVVRFLGAINPLNHQTVLIRSLFLGCENSTSGPVTWSIVLTSLCAVGFSWHTIDNLDFDERG